MGCQEEETLYSEEEFFADINNTAWAFVTTRTEEDSCSNEDNHYTGTKTTAAYTYTVQAQQNTKTGQIYETTTSLDKNTKKSQAEVTYNITNYELKDTSDIVILGSIHSGFWAMRLSDFYTTDTDISSLYTTTFLVQKNSCDYTLKK